MPSLRLALLALIFATQLFALPAPSPGTFLQERTSPEGLSDVTAAEVLAAIASGIKEASSMRTNTTLLSVKAAAAATNGGKSYSSLVAFGASYTDNAHARESKYAGSLRNYYPYDKWSGRYCNGPVAVEQMSSKFGGRLLNYAYGGSVISNGLYGTSSSWPSATDGVRTYLAEVKSSKVSVGSGRVLHYFNNGINGQFQLWNQALSAGMSDAAINKAKEGTSAQIGALAAAVRSISKDSSLSSKADFLLVGIPPLEIVPTSAYQVPSSYSKEKKAKALNFLKTITAQYNSELANFASQLNAEVRSKGGKAVFYDLAGLFYDMHSNPKSYGITVSATSTCYNSGTGTLCGNPSAYLYLDSLHPTTSVHGVMASKMTRSVLG